MNPGTAALARGLETLAALARETAARDGLGVVRLAELIGVDKSQMSRTLATLEEHGFVRRDPETLAYRLGWRLFGLAAQAAEHTIVAAQTMALGARIAAEAIGVPLATIHRQPTTMRSVSLRSTTSPLASMLEKAFRSATMRAMRCAPDTDSSISALKSSSTKSRS